MDEIDGMIWDWTSITLSLILVTLLPTTVRTTEAIACNIVTLETLGRNLTIHYLNRS